MLNFFKKSETPTQPNNSPIPTSPPPALEIGKEVTFKDLKTNEWVYQRALTSEQKKSIIISMQKNSQCANTSIQLSRQRLAVEKAIIENDNQITITEKEINDSLQKVRDELKIDKRWGLNPNLMILERRDPPEG